MNKIIEAKRSAIQTLSDMGFSVDNLWSTIDVTSKFVCTEQEAADVLFFVLNSDRIMNEINEAIDDHCENLGMAKKDQ